VTGVSQARASQIEHGKVTEVDAVRGYVEALGGTVDVVAQVGDCRSGSMSAELKCVIIACIVASKCTRRYTHDLE
jgi:hypothetical protein